VGDAQSSPERDIGHTHELCLSRHLSQESVSLHASQDNGDKRDNHLPEFSETLVDDEISERAAIMEFDGRLTRDEAEQFALKKMLESTRSNDENEKSESGH
jgi:hypothetical protein